MPDEDDLEALRAELSRLREERGRLERIAAAASEAHAFFAGRRPGFAPSYPRDVLRAAFAAEEAAPAPRKRRPPRAKPRARRKS